MKLKRDALVLVVDGSRMLLLRNNGSVAEPDLAVVEHRQFESEPNRTLFADAPGLSAAKLHPGRSTHDQGDPHREREIEFCRSAAALLDKVLLEGEGDVIVVAPPQALGELRRHYSKEVSVRLTGEVAKDLVKHPVGDITRLLLAYED
ncbi:MAG: hypothetical protein RL339_2484 [Pseudomonadota bacterium]